MIKLPFLSLCIISIIIFSTITLSAKEVITSFKANQKTGININGRVKNALETGYLDAQSDSSFILKAIDNLHMVIVGNKYLKVEASGNLGFWSEASEYAYWNINVVKSGKYKITVRYAVDNAVGFASKRIAIQSQYSGSKITFTTVGTGGWQNYQNIDLDSIQLNAGQQQLKICSDDGQGPTVNLTIITLKPAGGALKAEPVARLNNNVIYSQQYSSKSGSVSVRAGLAPADTCIGKISSGDWVKYANIDFGGGGNVSFMANISVVPANAGRSFEIHTDSPSGKLLGTLTTTSTGSENIFKEQYAVISDVTGVHDVYLVFPQDSVANIDWFVFSKYNGKESKAEKDLRMQWWRDARFGRFIHWGGYSELEGTYNAQTSSYAEWIMSNLKISMSDYEKNATKLLNPVLFDAKTWVDNCKAAGQKYIVFTSKHHEGFAMFDNDVKGFKSVTESGKLYDIVHFSKYGKDPMMSLALESKKQGIKFCAYHSIMDWHHASQDSITGNMKPGQKDIYVSQMKEQLQEIISKYDVELLWFDGEWNNWWTTTDGQDLYKYLRTIKPSLIINNRVGKRADTDGDFGTPEQQIPGGGLSYDWESCMTVNDTWGYSKSDINWKNDTTLITNLIKTTSTGGNFLLNVGPTPEGFVPLACETILSKMGDWLKVNGTSIYGATRSEYQDVKFGAVTANGTNYFLHVWNVDATNKILFPMVTDPTCIPECFLLKDSTKLPVQVTDKGLIIDLTGITRNAYVTVIVLKAKGKQYVNYVVPEPDNSYVLSSNDVHVEGSYLNVENSTEKNLGRWTNATDYAYWNVEVPKNGKYLITIRSAVESSALAGHRIAIQSEFSGSKVVFTTISTGGWQIYNDTKLDSIQLIAGKQQIKINSDDGQGPYVNVSKITLTPASMSTLTSSLESNLFNLKVTPNPINDNAQISFCLNSKSLVKIKAYNSQGQFVSNILDRVCSAEVNSLNWKSNLVKGIYFIQLQTNKMVQTVKIVK